MKLFIFGISVFGSGLIFLFRYSVDIGLCLQSDYICRGTYDVLERTCYFFILVLFFSLVTYKLPSQIFTKWWKFAKVIIPLVLVSSFLINKGILHSSSGTWQEILDWPVNFLMYLLFILGSLIQIIRGYYQK